MLPHIWVNSRPTLHTLRREQQHSVTFDSSSCFGWRSTVFERGSPFSRPPHYISVQVSEDAFLQVSLRLSVPVVLVFLRPGSPAGLVVVGSGRCLGCAWAWHVRLMGFRMAPWLDREDVLFGWWSPRLRELDPPKKIGFRPCRGAGIMA
jgi:hypothetical protein